MSIVKAFLNLLFNLLKVFTFLVIHDELHGHFVLLLHESCLQLFQFLNGVAEDNDVGDVGGWCQPIFEKGVDEA
jgi:hypothetical protein